MLVTYQSDDGPESDDELHEDELSLELEKLHEDFGLSSTYDGPLLYELGEVLLATISSPGDADG